MLMETQGRKVLAKPEDIVSSVLFYSIKTISHCDVFFWPERPLLLCFVLFCFTCCVSLIKDDCFLPWTFGRVSGGYKSYFTCIFSVPSDICVQSEFLVPVVCFHWNSKYIWQHLFF